MAQDVAIGAPNLDANGNVLTNLPKAVEQAGFAMLAGQLSASTDPVGALNEPTRTSVQGRLSVGQPVMLLNEIFSTTALNTALFASPVTTMTITVGGGTLNLNASALNSINTVARVTTYAYYPLVADFATYATWDMLLSTAPQINCTIEAGFFQASASALPTDGAFFRYDSAGTLKAVLNNNGVEYTTTITSPPGIGVMTKHKIVCENDRVLYYIAGACVAIHASPSGLGTPMWAQGQPFSVRIFNGAVIPAVGTVVKVAYLFIGMQDAVGLGKDHSTVLATGGKMGSQGQSGQTMGSTALLGNNLAAGAGIAMTNTTAATGSGLGGQFSYLPTLAVATDGILQSYQNPLPTAAIPGRTLYIKGIKISSVVTTVLAGNASPIIMEYSLAYGHTAVSLATGETATSKSPRRIPLGFETFAAAAAVGTLGGSPVYVPFTAPIAINPGEFVQVAAKNLGAVTTTGVITALVSYDSYWE